MASRSFALGFVLFLAFIEFFLFGKLPFLLPNESPWNTNHFFNFLYEWEIAKSPKTKKRVLVLGSSIAYYSLDKKALEEELRKSGVDSEVVYLAYAGNSPLYVYLMKSWLDALEPDLIVYPLNFIDLRLHRTYVLFPAGSNETVEEETLVQDALTFIEAPQSLWIFPWETLREVSMPWDKKAEYFFSSIFRFYRWKNLIWENINVLYQHRYGRNTSYHAYAGVDIPERVNFMGWTGKTFSFQAIPNYCRLGEGFWIEVPLPILKQGPLTIQFSHKAKTFSFKFEKPGWKQVVLPKNFCEEGITKGELSRTWLAYEADGTYLDYHYDPMGVRLTQTFGLAHPRANSQYLRPKRKEDYRYLGMSDKEYEKYFNFRLLEGLDKRPGIGYLVALEKAKKRIAGERFRSVFHLRYLEKFLRETKYPILLINNPENPISLDWYGKSEWYKGYLSFLKSLESDQVEFLDLKDSLPMQGFSDFHHFTYPGMESMLPIYAKAIRNRISK